MQVKDVMQSEVATCHVDDNLQSLALLMWNNDCGAIPVVDSARKPIGVVTDRDIAMGCALNNRPPWDMRAGDIIGNRPLISCQQQDDISEAVALMRDQQVRRLPVSDESESLVGMLSLSDLIQMAQKHPSRSKSLRKISFDQLVEALKSVTAPYARSRSNQVSQAR